MKKIILAILLALPIALSAQNRHLDDLRAGDSVQFEQKNDKAYVLVAMRKIDDTYFAVVQFDPIPNKDEDMLCFCEIKGQEIELYLVDAPTKPLFYIKFDGDNAKLRIATDERWVTMYRKKVTTKY